MSSLIFILAGMTSGCIDLPWEKEINIDVEITAHIIDDTPALYNMTGNYTAIEGTPSTVTVYTFTPLEGSNTTGTFSKIATMTLQYDNGTVTIPEAKQYTGKAEFEWNGKGAICIGYREEHTSHMDGICIAIVDFSATGGTVTDTLKGTATVHHWLPS